MECGICAEGESTTMAAFKFNKEVGVLFFEAIEHLGADHDNEVAELAFATLNDGVECALDLDTHGHRSFNTTTALAVWTWL